MEKSVKFDYWKEQYFLDAVKLQTLNRLVAAEKLKQREVDEMVSSRQEIHGY